MTKNGTAGCYIICLKNIYKIVNSMFREIAHFVRCWQNTFYILLQKLVHSSQSLAYVFCGRDCNEMFHCLKAIKTISVEEIHKDRHEHAFINYNLIDTIDVIILHRDIKLRSEAQCPLNDVKVDETKWECQ